MIIKVVTRQKLGDPLARIRDRDYWLNRPASERLAAVGFLRRQLHGDPERIVRRSDFRALLALFNDDCVEYLLVGGYALAHHGAPRYTGDMDLFVHATPENATRVLEALAAFGFGALGLTQADFCEPDQVIQLGHPPVRIDLLTGLDGVSWDDAMRAPESATLDGVPVNVIGREAFIANKRAAGRPSDLADLDALGES
jgi:predicted nucleotidyltransferase